MKTVLALVLFLASQTAFASVTGLWRGSNGDYWLLMQEASHANVVGVRVNADLSGASAWSGGLQGNSLSLAAVNGNGQLEAGVGQDVLSGTYSDAGGVANYSASLMLAYAGSAADGIWLKSTPANSYFAIATVNSQGTPITLAVDITFGAAVAYDIFAGSVSNDNLVAVSLLSGTRLSFDPGTGTGVYLLPPWTTIPVSASLVFAIQ